MSPLHSWNKENKLNLNSLAIMHEEKSNGGRKGLLEKEEKKGFLEKRVEMESQVHEKI
jgi:hypothetical protein